MRWSGHGPLGTPGRHAVYLHDGYKKGDGVEHKHSGFGVAAFVTSVSAGVLLLLLFIVAGVMEVSTPGGIDENSASAMLVGLFLILFLLADVVAAGLAIVGLLQKDRKKIFAALGLVFSVAMILCTLVLVVIGNAL